MRLNGSALNSMRLNASAARLPVGFAADAIGVVASVASGTRIPTMSGDMVFSCEADFSASALRRSEFSLVVAGVSEFFPNVQRMGVGEGFLSVGASLYYSKLSLGFGSALVSVEFRGDVGIVFGDGEATFDPLELEVSVSRRRHGAGDAAAEIVAGGEASAVRRPAAALELRCGLSGVLEPTHVTAGGVRYVGMFAEAPVTVLPEDAGMLRQAFLGSMDLLALAGAAEIRNIRTTLAGAAVAATVLAADFQVLRRAAADAVTEMVADSEFFCLVEGEGQAAIVSAPSFLASVQRFGGGVSETCVVVSFSGLRAKVSGGDAQVSCVYEMKGSRVRFFSGDAVIEALSFTSPVVNPYAEDDDEQTFNKPGMDRVFVRPAISREFLR